MQNSNNYDGPLYAPWSAVVEGRGFDPVEHRKQNGVDYRRLAREIFTEDSYNTIVNGKVYFITLTIVEKIVPSYSL